MSSLVDADITRATASVGRRIGVHWFVQGKGGAAAVSPIHEITQVSESAQLVANGSLGYRLISQTFIATFDRTPSISYGIGSGNTTAVGGAWQWRPLGRTWSLSANIRQQTIRETSSGSLTGWLGSGTLFKAVSRRVGIQFAYSYLNNTGTSIAGLRNLKVQTVQTALVWRSAAAR